MEFLIACEAMKAIEMESLSVEGCSYIWIGETIVWKKKLKYIGVF